MVAPTRTPQARGVKCELCKRILSLATWLDQTKLARDVESAQIVLDLIDQHSNQGCPCIPKNIENLLVGSTHFEIHRIIAKQLDLQVHKQQTDCFLQARQRVINETSRAKRPTINDCYDSQNSSRFHIALELTDKLIVEESKLQVDHLCYAIDYWESAMVDQANPFNSKLAHRLGLTHHVIYACYLFKYYKILDYQLISSNLLLNVFKSIEGVTANAVIHATFLLIKSLIDCDKLQLARHYLKQATKISNYSDKSHYESILLDCVACELNILDRRDEARGQMDELAKLAVIQEDDKLQHYYARTLAISVLLNYNHCFASRSELCFEFFHAYRFICAMIRRCYEGSFELVIAGKELDRRQTKPLNQAQKQILDYSWIRYAICDFVYTTFDHLTEFYIRAGMPECLDLLYNGLSLISVRNNGYHWQSRILSLGIRMDLLCDKYDDAKRKLDTFTCLTNQLEHDILHLELKVTQILFLDHQNSIICEEVIYNLLDRLKKCNANLVDKIELIELYDIKSSTSIKLSSCKEQQSSIITPRSYLNYLGFIVIKVGVRSLIRENLRDRALKLVDELVSQIDDTTSGFLDYFSHQIILEIILQFAGVEKSNLQLIEAVSTSQIFLKIDDKLCDLGKQLSSLTIDSEIEISDKRGPRRRPIKSSDRIRTISLAQKSRKKGSYEVAKSIRKNDLNRPCMRIVSTIEALKNIDSLTKEELLTAYLRNSEPNPDYNLYRCANELMFCHRLADEQWNSSSMLYHFSESISSNTMRYRWMMMEEQQMRPFDKLNHDKNDNENRKSMSATRQLSFCNALANHENTVKSMIRTLPESYRLTQIKYIVEEQADLEHLFLLNINVDNDLILVHVKRSIIDDFCADFMNKSHSNNTIPNRLHDKIEESKRSLLSNNHKVRSQIRQQIDADIRLILHDLENDWLGPFRFLLCGEICDLDYQKFIDKLMKELPSDLLKDHSCKSVAAFRSIVANAPLLSRDEFCRLVSIIFDCSVDDKGPRECFNRWQKSTEFYMTQHNLGSNKLVWLQRLERGQVGIILDKDLELIPFESLPIIRVINQGIFRVPSLRLFSVISNKHCSPIKIDIQKVAYMLDPANNLPKTRERFDHKLKAQVEWTGTIGKPPDCKDLQEWLSTKQLYIFIGHGAGTVYYNKLCKDRGLTFMSHIESAAIVMGCSSGRMLSEGKRLENYGVGWVFVFRGSPCYLGLLWDVTDIDIDKYLDALLDDWMSSIGWSSPIQSVKCPVGKFITDASAKAKYACQLKFLVGSTPVVYGLPVICKK